MKTSIHLLRLFVGLSTLAGLAAWQKKKLETAKAESKPRALVHTRRCGPTELFPVLSQIRARLEHGYAALAALDSGMRVRPSWDARHGFHHARTSSI